MLSAYIILFENLLIALTMSLNVLGVFKAMLITHHPHPAAFQSFHIAPYCSF